MLYVVYDDGVIVYTSQDRRMAQLYAEDRATIVGSDVFLSEYELGFEERIVADDD